MPSRFLNNININDEYSLPNADGSADQIITTDGAGQLSFVDQSTINAGNAEHVVIYAKNTSGSQINKGTPVYITGTVGATDTVQIAPADASDSAKMPAVGLLDDTLAINAFGYVITGGFMDNITTDPIDGAQPASNDTVYVKVGGGLTLTKPTGPTGLIQNIAKVGKVSGGNSGSLIVSSILRTNDVPNLTTGKIWVGDGNTVESTVVHLDEPNGRMGIGTASPQSKLQLNGGDGLTVTANDAAYVANYFGRMQSDYGTNALRLVSRAGDVFRATNYGQDVAILTGTSAAGTSERMRIDSSGKVGIGTTSPSEKLDVVGGSLKVSDTYATVKIIGTGGLSRVFLGDTADEDVGYLEYNHISNYFRIGVNAAERMRIDSSGNVGIGTTSPQQKLHVAGNGRFESGATGLGGYVTVGNPQETAGNYSAYFFGNTIHDNIYMKGAIAYETLSTTNGRGDMHFLQNSAANGTNASISDSVMTILNDGNVGIGTTSPNNFGFLEKVLNISAGSSSSTTLQQAGIVISGSSDGDDADDFGYLSFTNYQSAITNDRVAEIRALKNGTNVDTGEFAFYTSSGSGPAERMRITSSGNVGIGTTSPSAKLQISTTMTSSPTSNIFLDVDGSNTTGGGGSIIFGTSATAGSTTSYNAKITGTRVAGGLGGDSELGFWTTLVSDTTTAQQRMTITKEGNVGIGTTSPGAKLEVNNSSISGKLLKIGQDSSGYWEFLNAGNPTSRVALLAKDSSGVTKISINPTSNSYFNNGNVGIGTTSPGTKLHVGSGSGATVDTGYQMVIDSAGIAGLQILSATTQSGRIVFGDSGDNDIGMIKYDHTDNSMGFRTNGSGNERMRIDSSGNVGIGTTSPSAKLEVYDGDIKLNDSTRNLLIGEEGSSSYQIKSSGYLIVDATSGIQINKTTSGNVTIGSGNVGIGTTSPQSPLHIYKSLSGGVGGELRLDNNNVVVANKTRILFSDGGGASGSFDRGAIVCETEASPYMGQLQFQTGIGAISTKMLITGAGNVGIGTTSPLAKLQVNSITASAMSQVAGEAHIVGVNHDLSDTQMGTLNLTSTSRDASTNNQALGPSLTFSQNASKYVDGYEVVIGGIKTELMYTGNMNKSSIMNFYTHTNSGLTPKMSIDAAGNVGIGTSGPSEKLEVSGNVKMAETSATTDTDKFVVLDSGVLKYRTGAEVLADIGAQSSIVAPNAPTNLTTTIVNSTINVTFTASTTSGIDYYLVFSSVDGGDYGLISVIPPADFGATMSIIDDSFDATGTQAYRVYAVKNGVYSSPLTGNKSFSVTTPLEPTNMSVVNLNTAYYVQWDPPSANTRFVTAYNVYKHESATQASLSRSSATLVYSGMNTSYMYQISGNNNNNFHQFWVETTIA